MFIILINKETPYVQFVGVLWSITPKFTRPGLALVFRYLRYQLES